MFGCYTKAKDGLTLSDIPHRALKIVNNRKKTIAHLRDALIRHHADDEKLTRIKRQLERLDFDQSKLPTNPFPRADETRKGNLSEVFLSEYISAATEAELPIYRLRYNTNVEQSMKGDDVLAFDFSKKPIRIIVGEAKFRSTSSRSVVQEMVNALLTSHKAGVPSSLQFVADRLFETGHEDVGTRVLESAEQISNGNHDLRYVGFLMSTRRCGAHVDKYTEPMLPKFAVLSFTEDDLSGFLEECYDRIEEEAFGTPE